MQQAEYNPEENKLPGGVSEDQLRKAVERSGYPLQRSIGEQLRAWFDVAEEWGYVDREKEDQRSLDLLASREIKPCNRLSAMLALLVECKRTDLPYIFFEAITTRPPRDFPIVAGLQGKDLQIHTDDRRSTSAPPSRVLGLKECSFVADGPPMCSAMARAERKGKELDLSGTVPFNKAVLPLVSAADYFVDLQKRITSYHGRIPVCLTHLICVVDGGMVLARGQPSSPQLSMCPWVRLTRQEAARSSQQSSGFWRHYAVDFVHRFYVARFLADHVFPFADEFARRVECVEDLLVEGVARVPALEEWEFKDVTRLAKTG